RRPTWLLPYVRVIRSAVVGRPSAATQLRTLPDSPCPAGYRHSPQAPPAYRPDVPALPRSSPGPAPVPALPDDTSPPGELDGHVCRHRSESPALSACA